jgi:hypothetical protein
MIRWEPAWYSNKCLSIGFNRLLKNPKPIREHGSLGLRSRERG